MTSTSGFDKECRVGGEFGLSPTDFLKPATNALNPPRKKNYLYLDTGRSAIYVALLSILRQGGKKKAWLPRYCCQSVLLPFADLGFKLHFYSLGSDLNAPAGLPAELEGETFLFIHYFGKNNRPVLRYLERMKKHCEFFVIEDCVQALLNADLGTHDFVVYSYRKFFPQPDGALLASDFPLSGDDLTPANEAFVSRRLIGQLIRCQDDAELFLDLLAQAEEIIDTSLCPREMSFISHYLLARTDAAEIAEKRRNNFFYLTESIKQLALEQDLMRPLFDSLEHGEVPLGLPVVVNPAYRDKLRNFLTSKKIYCPVHWPLPIEASALWPNELKLSRSLLTLPLDQRLDCSALDYLVDKISEFFSVGRR